VGHRSLGWGFSPHPGWPESETVLPRRSLRASSGQAAIFTVLCLTSLVGAVALVIDVGVWRTERGHMVNAADAAALAGAAALNQGPDAATSIAITTARTNGASGATAVTLSGDAPNDTIRVHVTSPGRPYFSRLFGIGDFDISADATAVIRSYHSMSKTPVFPVGVTPSIIPATGTETTLKFSGGSGATGNYGSIELPYEQDGCQAGNGADWSRLLEGTYTPCKLSVDDTIPSEPGAKVGPTDNGLDQRIGTNSDTFDDVVELDPNGGLATILKPDSPRLVAIPIVVNAADGTEAWPLGGSGELRVVGFAYFFITGWDRGEVRGIFIQGLAELDEDLGAVTQGGGIFDVKLTS
jgi:hypothetical protein